MSKGSRDENGCLKVQEMRSTARVKLTSYRNRMLCIFYEEFISALPTEMGNLFNLRQMYLAVTQLSGSVPS